MSKWDVHELDARVEGDPIFLQAWAVPIRAPVDPADPWGPTFAAKAEANGGADPTIGAAAVHVEGGRTFGYVDVSFQLKNVGPVVLKGAVTELDGRDFLFAVMAPARLSSVADKDRNEIARRLEFSAELAPAGFGGAVTAGRGTTTLPPDWRPIAASEVDRISAAGDLGLADLTGCWTAVRPRVGDKPDVLITCSRPLHLGVVDAYSWAGHEEVARKALFGASVPAGQLAAAGDRSGITWAPREGLAFGVVPDSDRVQVTWGLGGAGIDAAVAAVLGSTTFSEPHAVTVGDQVSYWLGSRWSSPVVLCPAGCGCAGLGFVVVAVGAVGMLRGRRRGDDEDDG
ncbi:MAG: hypothetical protein ABMA64_40605 [Myxococcota bacterium]